ncbi:hypothetical protein FNV43_RR13576 [Rhamnella rubrinervis]|uniref:Epidermal patterning factor-like protein n=1 Tax=Rhamnella rubrinervis TaxID=2594499 RepID=A0A8K0MFD1_9ROSA|nr:hypothetical protein FNV43_RR13576 [Rhamnella rubrinervis]
MINSHSKFSSWPTKLKTNRLIVHLFCVFLAGLVNGFSLINFIVLEMGYKETVQRVIIDELKSIKQGHGHHHLTQRKSEGTSVAVAPKQNMNKYYWERKALMDQRRKPDTVQVAGSSLPDCSHACGSCSPCRLVMVSFVCASLEEAETCPMAYKCMCRNKSYPVP